MIPCSDRYQNVRYFTLLQILKIKKHYYYFTFLFTIFYRKTIVAAEFHIENQVYHPNSHTCHFKSYARRLSYGSSPINFSGTSFLRKALQIQLMNQNLQEEKSNFVCDFCLIQNFSIYCYLNFPLWLVLGEIFGMDFHSNCRDMQTKIEFLFIFYASSRCL